MPRAAKKPAARKAAPRLRTVVLVATRKGAWLLSRRCRAQNLARRRAAFPRPHHQPSGARPARRPHAAGCGEAPAISAPPSSAPPIFGRSWKEAARPPAFPKAPEGEKGPQRRSHVLAHARPRERARRLVCGHLAAGPVPQRGRRRHLGARSPASTTIRNIARGWAATQDGTPDGPKLHSIIVDPRDPAHLYFGMSSGGVHESLDGGANWAPLVKGMEVVEGFDAKNIAFHDPHCVRMCPTNPDRLYQQNHCGIYRLDRPSHDWTRIGKTMPKRVGDIGFPMVVHPRDDDTAWVFPMDGTDRVAAHQRRRASPAPMSRATAAKAGSASTRVCPSKAWWTVKRQAMTADARRSRRPLFRHHQRRAVDEPRRRRDAGPASRGICRKSTRCETGGS